MTETKRMEFFVAFDRPSRTWGARIQSEANLREHWGAKKTRARRQRAIVGAAWERVTQAGPRQRPRLPALVTLTRIAPRALDSDNLTRAFKAVRDEVAAQLGVDDRDPRVKWVYGQRRGEPRVHGMAVAVEWHATGTRWATWDQAADIEVRRGDEAAALADETFHPPAAHGCAEEIA